MGNGLFITFGGVRFHKDTIVEKSESINENGEKQYNVTLDTGTKVSYPEQRRLNNGYKLEVFKRNAKVGEVCEQVQRGQDRTPMILSHGLQNNKEDADISIYGLDGATIIDNKDVAESISFYNCSNNSVFVNNGNRVTKDKHLLNDNVYFDNWYGNNKNNTVYVDNDDYVGYTEHTNKGDICEDGAPKGNRIVDTEM